MPILIRPQQATDGSNVLGMPARSALTWVITSHNSSSTFSFDTPTTSTLGTPASSRRGGGGQTGAGRSGRQLEEIDGGICLQPSL